MYNKIDLFRNKSYTWSKKKGCYVCGYAFVGNKLLRDIELCDYFLSSKDKEDIISRIKKLNGFFSVIIETDKYLFAAVDHIRSIPLFWSKNQNNFYITDSLNETNIYDKLISKRVENQLRTTLFTFGQNTIFEGIFQIGAGEYLYLENDEVKICEYYTFNISMDNSIKDNSMYFKLLDEAYTNITKRLIVALEGRKAVIPLSGGHDSRIIAYYLKKLGYNRVISYTYGEYGNEESEISKKVAKMLDIPWYFIEYSKKEMRKLFSNNFHSFALYSGSGTTVPCLQEWRAIESLISRGIIDENCVIIPGHTGDFICGEHLLKEFLYKKYDNSKKIEYSTKYIMNKHCQLINFNKNSTQKYYKSTKKIVNSIVEDYIFNNKYIEIPQIYEKFNWKERQAKYICNSVRTYEYYNLKWIMPLWDKEIVDLWMNIPLNMRIDRNLFIDYVNWLYPELMIKAPIICNRKHTNNLMSINIVRYIYKIIFGYNSHYAFKYVSYFEYIKNLCINKSSQVNSIFNAKYLAILFNSISSNNVKSN